MERYYSIHGIVTFKIAGRLPRRLRLEYASFESNKIDCPDFVVYLGKFTPRKEGCQVLDSRYFVRQDYLYTCDSHKMGRFDLELSGFETGNMVCRLHTNMVGSLAADMFICAYVLDPLIRYVLIQKGCSPVHAAAVASAGLAYLFPAQSGAGKTTTAAYFAQEGFDFMGDDFVILRDGKVFSCLTPLNTFAYNLSPAVRSKMGLADIATIKMKSALYRVTRGYAKIFSKLDPAEAFPTCAESRLKAAYFMVPGDRFGLSAMPRDDLIKRLCINWEMESFPFNRYMLEYAYAFPESRVAGHWDMARENLESNIPQALPIYRVEVPRRYAPDTFRQIAKVVGEQA